MKKMGYGVYKKENVWVFTETKLSCSQFVDLENGQEDPEEEEPLFVLPFYSVKKIDGLRPWQVGAVSRLAASIDHWGAAIDGSDTGVGKCLTKGTLVKMYDGRTKKVEDIVVGDTLMGDDSTHREVLSLARGQDILYKIKPLQYGEEWGCNSEHILVLYNTRTKQLGEFSVKEYIQKAEKSTRFKHEWKLIRASVDYPTYDTLISPYLMGLWIGDGTWNSLSITASRYEKEIIDFLYSYAKCNSCRISESKSRVGSDAITFYIRGLTHGKNEQWDVFKKYGIAVSREKFIPKAYLLNDRHTRLSLLAGIIDSDGSKCNNGCYEITTKWDRLKDDIIELCRSLGYGVSYVQREILEEENNFEFGGKYWRIHISGAHDVPCHIERKRSSPRQQVKSVLVSGFEIERIGYGDYYGFEISGNRRFLLGDFTITHNTYTACGVAREMNMNLLVICPKQVITSWGRVIKGHFKMNDRSLGIVNYESLRVGRKDSAIASIVWDNKSRRNKFLWKIPKDTLIVWDEAQKLKNWKTKNSKTCLAAKKQGYKMLFCSATMAVNPMDLRTVGTCMKMFKSANDYYEWLYSRGVSKGRFGLEFNNDPDALKKIHKELYDHRGVRLTRDEIPGFPESEIIAECYNMDEESTQNINKVWEEMRSELTLIERKEKKEQSRMGLETRARQKAEMIKIPLFIEMIEEGMEQGFSVAVFVNYTETVHALAKRLNTNCIYNGEDDSTRLVKVGGEEKKLAVRDINVDLFQANKEKVIIINLASGGSGLSLHDLHGGHPRLALISPSYDPRHLRQSFGRVWRDDAKTKSIQKIVFVAGTIEDNICRNVQQKLKNMDLLNDGDLKYASQYEIVKD